MKPLANFSAPVTFDPVEHTYMMDGVFVPGVTSILDMMPKPWMAPWAKKMMGQNVISLYKESKKPDIEKIVSEAKKSDRKKSEEGKAKGTTAHEWIERHIKEEVDPPMPDSAAERTSILMFVAWEEARKPKYEACELVIGSRGHRYGGKLDFIASVDGSRNLYDIKTNKTISETWGPQTAAYTNGLSECGGGGIEQRIVLRLPGEGLKSDQVEYPIRSTLAFDFGWFLSLKQVYDCLNIYNAATKTTRR